MFMFRKYLTIFNVKKYYYGFNLAKIQFYTPGRASGKL